MSLKDTRTDEDKASDDISDWTPSELEDIRLLLDQEYLTLLPSESDEDEKIRRTPTPHERVPNTKT